MVGLGVDVEQIYDLFLGLPGVQEYQHGRLPAFRVSGKRFASMLDTSSVNLMPGDELITMAAARWPNSCEENWFAGTLSSVLVRYRDMNEADLTELVVDSWRSKATKALIQEFDETHLR